ncbi:MAG: four helix bundle protein [Candidatus Dojkabacteria bacterium]
MSEYNLENRTLRFSKNLIYVLAKLPKDMKNITITRQLLRSGTSMGANYREANETTTQKDLKHRVMICKKEAKETIYWLELIKEFNEDYIDELTSLFAEAIELNNIFGAIYKKL